MQRYCSAIDTPYKSRWGCLLIGIFFDEVSDHIPGPEYSKDLYKYKGIKIDSPGYFSTTETKIVSSILSFNF